MANNYKSFTDRGAIIVALAHQDVSGAANTFSAVASSGTVPAFPILADPDGSVARAYNVFDGIASDLDIPATFVINSNRTIVWSHIASSDSDRPTAALTLSHLP